jgi:hypothetical protein
LASPQEQERLSNVRPTGWQNPPPRRIYDLLVIGAGPAGLVAARAAAALDAHAALIERRRLGGDSLNYGCIPSKSLIRTARLCAEMRHAENFGAVSPDPIAVDFPAVMRRLHRRISCCRIVTLGHIQAQVELNNYRVRPRHDVHDTKLVETSRRPTGCNHIFPDKLRHIDVGGARHELRVDLESKSEGIACRFIINAIDSNVVENQKMSTTMQLSG